MSKRGRIMVDDEMKKYYFAVITIVAIVAIVGVVLAANGAKRDYSTTSQNKDIIGKASSFIKDSSEANLRMILQNQKDEWIKYQQEHKEEISKELQRNNYIKDMVTSGEDFTPHVELTAEKERVAKDARDEAKKTLIESEQRTKMSCSEGEQLPLNLFFADYTIDTDGRIRISHSETDNSIELDVINGAFYGNAPWVRPYSDTDDYLVTIPGTLTFEFKPKGSKRVFSEKRTIIFGLGNGKHHFLLN